MSKRILPALLLLAIALVLAPSSAAEGHERVGTRINLFAGAFQVFPANRPFHISHGWGLGQSNPETTPQALGRYGFSLAVDGGDRREDYVEKSHVLDPTFGRLQGRTWIHNFPNGMTGTHTFTGHWFGACNGIVAAGSAPGPCEHPTALTTAIAPLTITVAFVP
jgi:hypothetical protein